jgi:hypothetical protein
MDLNPLGATNSLPAPAELTRDLPQYILARPLTGPNQTILPLVAQCNAKAHNHKPTKPLIAFV